MPSIALLYYIQIIGFGQFGKKKIGNSCVWKRQFHKNASYFIRYNSVDLCFHIKLFEENTNFCKFFEKAQMNEE